MKCNACNQEIKKLWVIANPVVYFMGAGETHSRWTTDLSRAVKFSTRLEAEQGIKLLGLTQCEAKELE